MRPGVLGRVSRGGDGHEAADLQVLEHGERREHLEIGGQILDREAVFGLLRAEVDLDQAGEAPALPGSLLVELESDGGTVDRMHDVEERHGLADLVRLQGAQEVPLDVGRQEGRLRDGLLHPVLAERAQAEGVGGGERLERLPLAGADQPDARAAPAGAIAGGLDPALDLGVTASGGGDVQGSTPRALGGQAFSSTRRKRLQPSHWTIVPRLRISTATCGRTW